MAGKETDEATEARGAYLVFLAKHNKGRSADELDEALNALVSKVMETGKKGKLAYTLTVAPNKNLDGMVEVTDEIKSTLPAFDRQGDLWFATDAGELMREHPHQSGLFDREGM